MTVFEGIYRRNAWHGVESRSGPGSGSIATAPMIPELLRLVADLEVTSVLDVGCGDGFWMPDLPGYVGIDVAPRAIGRARQRHPDRLYMVGTAGQYVGFDLVISRDAMQHLSLADGVALLAEMRKAGRWLLASTYTDGENVDIVTGDHYSPDLTVAPFNLGLPERTIFDGYGYHTPTHVRDPRKHLGLWRLAPRISVRELDERVRVEVPADVARAVRASER